MHHNTRYALEKASANQRGGNRTPIHSIFIFANSHNISNSGLKMEKQ